MSHSKATLGGGTSFGRDIDEVSTKGYIADKTRIVAIPSRNSPPVQSAGLVVTSISNILFGRHFGETEKQFERTQVLMPQNGDSRIDEDDEFDIDGNADGARSGPETLPVEEFSQATGANIAVDSTDSLGGPEIRKQSDKKLDTHNRQNFLLKKSRLENSLRSYIQIELDNGDKITLYYRRESNISKYLLFRDFDNDVYYLISGRDLGEGKIHIYQEKTSVRNAFPAIFGFKPKKKFFYRTPITVKLQDIVY